METLIAIVVVIVLVAFRRPLLDLAGGLLALGAMAALLFLMFIVVRVALFGP